MRFEKGRRARDQFRTYNECKLESDTIWKSLLLMEQAGLDLALRQPELHGYLTATSTFSMPAGDDVSLENAFPALGIEEERSVAVEIRALLRIELGLPELRPEEIAGWRYEERPFRSVKPWPGMTCGVFRDDVVIEQLANEVRMRDPELTKAINLFVGHNVEVRDHRRSFQTSWIERQVQEHVMDSNVVPDNMITTAAGYVVTRIFELENPAMRLPWRRGRYPKRNDSPLPR